MVGCFDALAGAERGGMVLPAVRSAGAVVAIVGLVSELLLLVREGLICALGMLCELVVAFVVTEDGTSVFPTCLC